MAKDDEFDVPLMSFCRPNKGMIDILIPNALEGDPITKGTGQGLRSGRGDKRRPQAVWRGTVVREPPLPRPFKQQPRVLCCLSAGHTRLAAIWQGTVHLLGRPFLQSSLDIAPRTVVPVDRFWAAESANEACSHPSVLCVN